VIQVLRTLEGLAPWHGSLRLLVDRGTGRPGADLCSAGRRAKDGDAAMTESRVPDVSIGLPVYNGADFLGAAIESHLAQTFGDFELVISDNASTDGTEELCRRYARQDRRIRYVRQAENIGANANYNEVVGISRAPYFRWAADDDILAPEYLEKTYGLLSKDDDAVLCHSFTTYIDEAGEPLRAADDGRGFVDDQGTYVDGPDPSVATRRLDSPHPHVRFRDVLLHTKWCFEIFGLLRREVLLTTPLHQRFYGTDRVLLAELSLLGTWLVVEEPLWARRSHSGASNNLSVWQKARWSNPDAKKSVLPPVTNMVRGYLGAIRRHPFPVVERAQCYAAVGVLAVQPDKFRKLLVPGPYNYFGIGNKRSEATHRM
jgi:glycosyltransferase involved in cell wall biosynthesis